MVSTNPIMGVGLDHFRVNSSSGLYSHNNYVEVFADTRRTDQVIFAIYQVLFYCLISRIYRAVFWSDFLVKGVYNYQPQSGNAKGFCQYLYMYYC